jgi:tetratricopeptide (TPR) repeat protein
MGLDRVAILRNAEKLLRQGRVDAAIAEYVRLVEGNPHDWNTANALGDLYVRAGKTDKAVEQFVRIADSLSGQGFLPKAAALYKKVLKIKPDHEHALLQAGEIAAQQGFYADARNHLGAVIARRKARGDTRGASQIRIRLGSLDPADFDARIAAASARLEDEDCSGAARDFVRIARDLLDRQRDADALAVLERAAAAAKDDDAVGAEVRQLLLTIAEARLRSASVDAGLAIANRMLGEDASQRDAIVALGCNVAAEAPETGFRVLELAVAESVAQRDWLAAAAALQAFAAQVPNHVPALMRLVEVCIDGGLDAEVDAAQAQLAEAYLARGRTAEARYIAEDLVARDPSDPARVERFRRALVLLGEPDPDAVIAERLSTMSLPATDDLIGEAEVPSETAAPRVAAPSPPPPDWQQQFKPQSAPSPQPSGLESEREPTRSPDAASRDRSAETQAPQPRAESTSVPSGDVFELSSNAVDIASIIEEFRPSRETAPSESPDTFEVDLSVVLDDMKGPPPGAGDAARPAGPKPVQMVENPDIEDVFAQLREEASRRSAIDQAEQEFRRGLALKAAGDIDGCVAAMQNASQAPKLRFATAALLGRLYRERGLTSQAAHWYERAAQAPAPTADEYHMLLFEFAEVLEAEGEIVRALAVCLELQADAGDYRDVATRVDRLAKVQARG